MKDLTGNCGQKRGEPFTPGQAARTIVVNETT
jgi:hypothetical protein